MCELLALSTRHAVHLNVSLEALASHSGSTGGTRDGWGATFYQGNDSALFREPIAASDSYLARWLSHSGPTTTLAIAHIRRATLGTVPLANTQPFVRELAGRSHVFAHNGHLPGITQSAGLACERYRPIGDTDSEHAFCALLERLHGLWSHTAMPPSVEQRLDVVTQFAADLHPLGPANFLYVDAEVLFAHGHRRIHPASGRIEPPGFVPLGAVEQHGGAVPACSRRGGRAGHAGRDLDRQRAARRPSVAALCRGRSRGRGGWDRDAWERRMLKRRCLRSAAALENFKPSRMLAGRR